MNDLFQAEKLKIGAGAVTLRVAAGEITAILHKRGDPSVSLLKAALSGQRIPDGGRMLLLGEEYLPGSVSSALSKGVCLAEAAFDSLTVRENLRLLTENTDEKLIQAYLPDVKQNRKAKTLSESEKTLLLILRSHLRSDRLLILNDPLRDADFDGQQRVLKGMERFASENRAIVYFTCSPSHAKAADRCAVLSDGIVWSGDPAAVSEGTLIDLVGGPEGGCLPEKRETVPGAVVMEVRGLSVRARGLCPVEGVSLEIRESEILGLLAKPGEGGETLLRALAGRLPAREGRVRLMGKSTAHMNEEALARKGVRYLPSAAPAQDEDLTVQDELVLRRHRFPGFFRHGLARRSQMRAYAEWITREYGVDAAADDPLWSLPAESKSMLRLCGELDRTGPVLLLEYPSRGLDAKGAQTLWDCLNDEKTQRTGILILSDDPEELLHLCDRVIVMLKGRTVLSIDTVNTSENELLQALSGRTALSYDLDMMI
ncbi:MAG: ATP-binding cassette domain-containing protein [Clostridia bacterium]|nr:ATP-binding cassette domain-containing protein [Clostridia bacterium]